MIDFKRAASFEDVVSQVKEQNEETIFRYEELAYENYQSYIEFLIDCDASFYGSPYGRLVRSQDVDHLFGLYDVELLELEDDPWKNALLEAEGVSYLDGLKFCRDFVWHRANCIFDYGTTWDMVVSDLVEVYNFPTVDESTAKDEVTELLEEHMREREQFEQVLGEVSTQSVEDGTILQQESQSEEIDYTEVAYTLLKEHGRVIDATIKQYEYFYEKEPSVGDYVVIETAHPTESEQIVRTIVKVTDSQVVERDGISYSEYEYDLVEYPDWLPEEVPKHFFVGLEQPINPSIQDMYVVYPEDEGLMHRVPEVALEAPVDESLLG